MRTLLILCAATCALALYAVRAPDEAAASPDDAASLKAFADVAKVLTHPRCMNCHTTTGWPTVGDDSHRHPFNVARGTDDRGAAGLHCATCHQDENQDTANIPGAKDWHMASLTMAWTGLSPGALCRALLDPKRNGGRTGDKVIDHMRADPLVLWAWAPGGKRAPPGLAHKDFIAAAETWIKNGAHCPAP